MKSFPAYVGLAVSEDGVNFEMARHRAGSAHDVRGYDNDSISSPSVVEFEGEMVMLYTAHCWTKCPLGKGLTLMAATSRDGRNWVKRTEPVLRKRDFPHAKDGIAEAEVSRAPDGRYYLFYSLLYGDDGHRDRRGERTVTLRALGHQPPTHCAQVRSRIDDIGPIARPSSTTVKGNGMRFDGFSKRWTIQIGTPRRLALKTDERAALRLRAWQSPALRLRRARCAAVASGRRGSSGAVGGAANARRAGRRRGAIDRRPGHGRGRRLERGAAPALDTVFDVAWSRIMPTPVRCIASTWKRRGCWRRPAFRRGARLVLDVSTVRCMASRAGKVDGASARLHPDDDDGSASSTPSRSSRRRRPNERAANVGAEAAARVRCRGARQLRRRGDWRCRAGRCPGGGGQPVQHDPRRCAGRRIGPGRAAPICPDGVAGQRRAGLVHGRSGRAESPTPRSTVVGLALSAGAAASACPGGWRGCCRRPVLLGLARSRRCSLARRQRLAAATAAGVGGDADGASATPGPVRAPPPILICTRCPWPPTARPQRCPCRSCLPSSSA